MTFFKIHTFNFNNLARSKFSVDQDHSAFERSISKVDCSVTNLVRSPEHHLDNGFEESAPRDGDLIPSLASALASDISLEKFPGQTVKGASPFRLLQDYASDDSTENSDMPCTEDVIPVTLPPSVSDDTSLHKDTTYNLESGLGTKQSCQTGMNFEPLSELESLRDGKEVVKTSIAIRTTDEHVVIPENQACISPGAADKASHEKGTGSGVDTVPDGRKPQKEMPPLKVDEFGRLVKEGASDSDSDDSHYTRKRSRRGRSRSRSRSPPGRRRRRRSPLKRKERRSRSPRYALYFRINIGAIPHFCDLEYLVLVAFFVEFNLYLFHGFL